RNITMKLQVACVILILVITAQNSCCFQDVPAGIRALSCQAAKRHNTHFPICTFCCKCCRNQGCGFCCRT
uniref:Hepcidin n=1 Tax=Gopherus agassizii TaxID=38772 RepID=A0A452GHL9_9SAUR